MDRHAAVQLHWNERRESGTELPQYKELLSAQKDLLYSLREHIDDCHLILQSLADPTGVKVRRPGSLEFLKAAKFPSLATFHQPLKPFLEEYFPPMVNKLKHKQGRLRVCMFFDDSETRPGYYLEEVDENEVAGPSSELHPGNTAFSFARDLRFSIFHIFFASERLAKAVTSALRSMHKFNLGPPSSAGGADPQWQEIVRRVSLISPAVFPQELQLPFPEVKLVDKSLVLEYPARGVSLNFPAGMRIAASTQGDGVTKSFRLPYLMSA